MKPHLGNAPRATPVAATSGANARQLGLGRVREVQPPGLASHAARPNHRGADRRTDAGSQGWKQPPGVVGATLDCLPGTPSAARQVAARRWVWWATHRFGSPHKRTPWLSHSSHHVGVWSCRRRLPSHPDSGDGPAAAGCTPSSGSGMGSLEVRRRGLLLGRRTRNGSAHRERPTRATRWPASA